MRGGGRERCSGDRGLGEEYAHCTLTAGWRGAVGEYRSLAGERAGGDRRPAGGGGHGGRG